MVNESRTASCLGLEKEESEEMNKPFTVVSTTNSLNFSESGCWGRILSSNEDADSNFPNSDCCLLSKLLGFLVVNPECVD